MGEIPKRGGHPIPNPVLSLREAPLKMTQCLFGHGRLGRAVSTSARMVWGTYLEKNFPSSNGHLLDCGGVKMLARMVWGTYAVKIEVQMGISFWHNMASLRYLKTKILERIKKIQH